MPRLIVPETRVETLVDAINALLAREGVPGLSLRAIARESGVTPSSMLHHFHSRDRLLRVAGTWTGRARLEVIERRAAREGAGAFLPVEGDEEDLLTARAWLSWCELWRCDPAIRPSITRIRDAEFVLLGRILGLPLRAPGLWSVSAFLDGLLMAVCAPEEPLPADHARDMLHRHLAGEPLIPPQ